LPSKQTIGLGLKAASPLSPGILGPASVFFNIFEAFVQPETQ
jgi:hypothetical protein